MRQRFALLVLALTVALAAAPARAGATTGSLRIGGFIYHFFSTRPSGYDHQIVGYDSNFDGVIDVQEEFGRVDGKGRVWQAQRFLNAVDAATGRDVFVSKADMRAYLRSFDRNHNRRIDSSNHEFQRLYRAVFHKGAPRRARFSSFERRFYG